MYRRFFKAVTDRLLAALGLLLLSPVMCLVALAVWRRLGSPVIFRQVRTGWRDRSFIFLKFRTMTDDRDRQGDLLPDDRRQTRFGCFLRESSLDEVPQLWNVIRGDMSLIGPRPLLPEYLPRYSNFQRRRHEVKPGITGLAQVKGRNAISWEEKFEKDVYYVDHCSLKLDVHILWMTVASVLRRDGISQPGHATAPPFLGSKREASE